MSQKWRTMLGVSLGAFCPPIAISTISIGLPVIATALRQPITSAEWVIVTYSLVITSLLMTFGRPDLDEAALRPGLHRFYAGSPRQRSEPELRLAAREPSRPGPRRSDDVLG